jgi:uncharacterized protein (DUF433 family)
MGSGTTMMPSSRSIEMRNGGCFLAGTRIGLDVVVYEFRDGHSPEQILQSYPSIGSLAKLYGAITFVLEHPKEVEAYLASQKTRYEEIEQRNPIPADMARRLEQVKELSKRP